MHTLIRSSFVVFGLALAALTSCGLTFPEEGVLVIHASDAEEEPLKGVVFSNKGDGTRSDPTDSAGVTRMALPKEARPNDWVHLQVLKGSESNDNWILISPWDGRLAVPSFDNKPDRFALVVVVRKFDKRLLANPIALRAMAATANRELGPKTPAETVTEEHRRAVLAEIAKAYGLGANEIDQAIRAWGEKAQDPYEIGLAALYESNYPLATEQLSKSLEIRESELELKKAEVMYAAFFLGQSLYRQGRYRESTIAYRKVLALRPDDVMIMNDLAMSLAETGSYAQAEPLFKQALEIWEKTLGPTHPLVGLSLNNLGLLYTNLGKYAEAERFLKHASEIWEKTFSPNDPLVALNLNNRAELCRVLGKYAEAESLYRRSLAILEKTLGKDHPNVGLGLNNLGLLYAQQGKYEEAERLFKRTSEIWEKTLDQNHPQVAVMLDNLGELYERQGKYAEAEPLFKRALAINEQALGADHPDVAIVLEHYADLLRKTNRENEAPEMEARAKAIRAKHEQKNPKN